MSVVETAGHPDIHSPLLPENRQTHEHQKSSGPPSGSPAGACGLPQTAGEHRWPAWLLTGSPFLRSVLSLCCSEPFRFLGLCVHGAQDACPSPGLSWLGLLLSPSRPWAPPGQTLYRTCSLSSVPRTVLVTY